MHATMRNDWCDLNSKHHCFQNWLFPSWAAYETQTSVHQSWRELFPLNHKHTAVGLAMSLSSHREGKKPTITQGLHCQWDVVTRTGGDKDTAVWRYIQLWDFTRQEQTKNLHAAPAENLSDGWYNSQGDPHPLSHYRTKKSWCWFEQVQFLWL